MNPDEAEKELEVIYDRLMELGLPRHHLLRQGVQRRGGLVVQKGWKRDSYISHKSEKGGAVSLAVVEPPTGTAWLVLHRRRVDGRAMPDVSVDRLPLEQIDLAASMFLETARLITHVPDSWLPNHPKDD